MKIIHKSYKYRIYPAKEQEEYLNNGNSLNYYDNAKSLTELNSSKMCSNCHWIKQDLTLDDRKWTCESCHVTHDRDTNASKNILLQGLNDLSVLGTNSDIKQKQVDSFSIEKGMKLEASSPCG